MNVVDSREVVLELQCDLLADKRLEEGYEQLRVSETKSVRTPLTMLGECAEKAPPSFLAMRVSPRRLVLAVAAIALITVIIVTISDRSTAIPRKERMVAATAEPLPTQMVVREFADAMEVARISDVPLLAPGQLPDSWAAQDWSDLVGGTAEDKAAASVRRYAFNAYKSAKLPLDREVPDSRSAECKAVVYPSAMPAASVIICFVDEMWSSLFRTVHSVINRSPPHLLKEIVLVDDASPALWLQRDLDVYITTLPVKVRLVRSKVRLGLIRARTLGAEYATGDILVFLDSHCEASPGWLEPIVHRIHEDHTAVLCPQIDAISDQTMDYPPGGPSIHAM